MIYDEEAVYQDADILQAQYEDESRQVAALNRRGICTHSWMLGRGGYNMSREEIVAEHKRAGKFPERPVVESVSCQNEIPKGQAICLDCGVLVDDPLSREGD